MLAYAPLIQWEDLSLGVAVVVGGVLVMIVIRKLIHDMLIFFGNHMSSVTEAQVQTARAMQSVADHLESLKDTVERKLEAKEQPT